MNKEQALAIVNVDDALWYEGIGSGDDVWDDLVAEAVMLCGKQTQRQQAKVRNERLRSQRD